MQKINLKDKTKILDVLMLVAVIFLGLKVRQSLAGFESRDWIKFLEPWTNKLTTEGFGALAEGFYDYTPGYMYVLWFITRLPIPALLGIKYVSIVFDFVLASVVTLICREIKEDINPLIPFSVVWICPTVISNSSMWGQCDAIYVSFLLLAILFILKEKWSMAMICYGVAFALKVQSVFFLPVIILLCCIGKVQIRKLLYIPLVYILSIVPAFFAGRNLTDLLMIYVKQTGTYNNALSFRYPNIYYLIGEETFVELYGQAGIWFCLSGLLIIMYYCLRKLLCIDLSKSMLVQIVLVSGAFAVYFMPFMHERYGFFVEIMAVIYAILYRHKWYVPVAYICSTFLAYVDYYLIESDVNFVILATIILIVLIDMLYTLWKTISSAEQTNIVEE